MGHELPVGYDVFSEPSIYSHNFHFQPFIFSQNQVDLNIKISMTLKGVGVNILRERNSEKKNTDRQLAC